MPVPQALDQRVRPDDLILIHTPYRGRILLVKSVDNDKDREPPTSSFTVGKVHLHMPDDHSFTKPGYWSFSGPEVYYVPKDDSDTDTDTKEFKLSTVLFYLAQEEGEEIGIIANPHGRFVSLPSLPSLVFSKKKANASTEETSSSISSKCSAPNAETWVGYVPGAEASGIDTRICTAGAEWTCRVLSAWDMSLPLATPVRLGQ